MHIDPTVLNTHDLAWKVLGKTKISRLRKICFRVFIAFPTIHWISPSTFQITQVKQPLWNQKDHFFSMCNTMQWILLPATLPSGLVDVAENLIQKQSIYFLKNLANWCRLQNRQKAESWGNLLRPIWQQLSCSLFAIVGHDLLGERIVVPSPCRCPALEPLRMRNRNVVRPILHRDHHHHQLQYAQPLTVPKKQWFSMI